MADPLQALIDNLRLSMDGLEARRDTLGDEIVEPALAALRQQLVGLEEQFKAQAVPVEERRMAAVLFMDIVGSASIAEKLDPEEWRQIVSKLYVSLSETIAAHHGSINQDLGDGLLAFIGSKGSRENDPGNAIRAALDVHAAVANSKIIPAWWKSFLENVLEHSRMMEPWEQNKT